MATAPNRIEPGAKAPAFDLLDHEGGRVASAGLAGRPYVLWFYPKADTPGCTAEGCAFRDQADRFRAKGLTILGVSSDTPEDNARFQERHRFPYQLLSDTDRRLGQAYGTWVRQETPQGERLALERTTILVDARGIVQRIWRAVKVPGHVDAVLKAAEEPA